MDLGGEQSARRMVAAGVDGSPESVAAARYAVQAASDRGMHLLLVHAYELPSIHVPVDPGLLDACRESARQLVADVAAQLVMPSSMRVETSIESALPAGLLLHEAAHVGHFRSVDLTSQPGNKDSGRRSVGGPPKASG